MKQRRIPFEYIPLTVPKTLRLVFRTRRSSIPEELLTILLVEFRDNMLDGVLVTRDDDVLNGVHSAVGQLDHLIQNYEGSLLGQYERQRLETLCCQTKRSRTSHEENIGNQSS